MRVVVIEPGAVSTPMLEQVERRAEQIVRGTTDGQRGRYAALMQAVVKQAQASKTGGVSPEDVGRVIANAITSKRLRPRYTIGWATGMSVRLTRLL